MSIRKLPAQAERVESGPIQFGDDWPGVFIRGDGAGYYALLLRQFLAGDLNLQRDFFDKEQLEGLQKLLASSVL